jgi:hypothetical protein
MLSYKTLWGLMETGCRYGGDDDTCYFSINYPIVWDVKNKILHPNIYLN